MPEEQDDGPSSLSSRPFSSEVGAKEARKVHARRSKDNTVWLGLGMFGVIGWSVVVPTLLGIALGIWLDHRSHSHGRFSWTLALLLAGATLGSLSAWHWISEERTVIDQEEREKRNRQ